METSSEPSGGLNMSCFQRVLHSFRSVWPTLMFMRLVAAVCRPLNPNILGYASEKAQDSAVLCGLQDLKHGFFLWIIWG